MLTEEVIAFLEVPFGYPAAEESGNALYEYVLAKANWLLEHGERPGVLDALRVWFRDRRHPRTSLATQLAAELKLVELRPELIALRTDIAAGRAFHANEVWWVERDLKALDATPHGSA